MANDLSFNDYQIIEKKIKKNNFFNNFLQLNSFKNKKQLENIKQHINSDVCDISKYKLSVILLNTKPKIKKISTINSVNFA